MGFKRLAAKRTTDARRLDEDLLRRVRAEVQGDRISCAAAFALAEKLNLSKADLGKALDELKIRIAQCQLGCF